MIRFTSILICGIMLVGCTTYNVSGSYNTTETHVYKSTPQLIIRNPDYPRIQK